MAIYSELTDMIGYKDLKEYMKKNWNIQLVQVYTEKGASDNQSFISMFSMSKSWSTIISLDYKPFSIMLHDGDDAWFIVLKKIED